MTKLPPYLILAGLTACAGQADTSTAESGFDEQRVDGIQPRRPNAPAPLSCPVVD